jgi:hypothetical protein
VSTDDRWVRLEGEAPDDVRELLDAAREVPPRPAEQVDGMKRSFLAALAEQRGARERARSAGPRLLLAFAAVCTVAGLAVAYRAVAPQGPPLAAGPLPVPTPTRHMRAREIPDAGAASPEPSPPR